MKNHTPNPSQASKYTIGIDLGGTKINMGLIDHEGNIIKSFQLPTDLSNNYQSVENQICIAIQSLDPGLKSISGIGIGLAGQVDDKGVVSFAPNLKWKDVAFKKHLEEKLHLPVCITNDVRAATYGEWQKGAGLGCNDLICLFVGTGIGGGVVCSGKLMTGATGCFGEIGHMIIDRHGPSCTCGAFGCFESLAGGWAIARQGQEAAKKHPEKCESLLTRVNGQIDQITAKEVMLAAREGDPTCSLIMKSVEEALVVGCVSLANLYNPERIIFGGGIIDGSPHLIEIAEKGIKRFALPAARNKLKVVRAQQGNFAGMIGAGLLAREKV